MTDEQARLRKLWNELTSRIFRVMDGETNPENGQVRHYAGRDWLYVNDVDGFKVVGVDVVDNLHLE